MNNNGFKNYKKVIRISIVIEIIIYLLIGGLTYFVYGDKTPEILIMRPENPSWIFLNWFIIILLFVFFLINNLGMAIFVPGIRMFLQQFKFVKKFKNYSVNICIFAIGFILSFCVPTITTIFWIMGLIICNWDGFIIPCLMVIFTRKIWISKQILISWLILFYTICGLIGTMTKIFK